MPIAVVKNASGRGYRVVNKATGAVHAKNTTKAKAAAQKRLIDAADAKKKRRS